MLDRSAGQQVAQRDDENRRLAAQKRLIRGDGGGDELDAEQSSRQLGQPILGRELIVQQINHDRQDRGPYCTGALTPSGDGHWFLSGSEARTDVGAVLGDDAPGSSGRSKTCRAPKPVLMAGVRSSLQAPQEEGKCSMTASGSATCRRSRL